jgi:hypothetical protein
MLPLRTKCALLLSICITLNTSLIAAEPRLVPKISVQTTDGRTLTGRIDRASDENQLTLVLATSRIVVTTQVLWKDINQATVGGKSWTAQRLRSEWKQLRLPNRLFLKNDHVAKPEVEADRPVSLSNQVESMRAIAWLNSWDRDAEPDGLELLIQLLDKTGRPIEAPGSYTARLVGLPKEFTGGQSTLKRTRKTVELEKWGDRIRSTRFEEGTLRVRLPFRRFDPNLALDIAAYSLLEVEYGIAGKGVFKASIADVLVREPSFFRDELQLRTGRRVLPSER